MSYGLKQKQDVYILAHQISRAIVRLFFSHFFSINFFWWVIHSFLVIFIYKRFNFCYFLISSCFKVTVARYSKHLLSILLIGFTVAFLFWSNPENLYMIHLFYDLFHDISNTLDKHKDKTTTSYWCFQSIFISIKKWLKSSSITFPDSSLIIVSMLLLFECITHSSSLSFKKNKVNCYC